MKKKIIIYIDLDNTLAVYPSQGKPESFLDLQPIPGAVEAFNQLSNDPRYDVYLASTAPWSNPQAWMDKRLWVERYLGDNAHKRLILTHHKNLLQGNYLIDDRLANGSESFQGVHVHFGQKNAESWKKVLKIFA